MLTIIGHDGHDMDQMKTIVHVLNNYEVCHKIGQIFF